MHGPQIVISLIFGVALGFGLYKVLKSKKQNG